MSDNPNLSTEKLDELVYFEGGEKASYSGGSSERDTILKAVAQHPNTSPKALEKIINGHGKDNNMERSHIIEYAVGNKNVSKETIEKRKKKDLEIYGELYSFPLGFDK
jgi:hypothetical protein